MLTLLQVAAKDDGWLAPITNTLNFTLQQIQTGLDQLHVPYSYGWAIIGLTVATKIVTFPFTKIQVCLSQLHLPLSWVTGCKIGIAGLTVAMQLVIFSFVKIWSRPYDCCIGTLLKLFCPCL